MNARCWCSPPFATTCIWPSDRPRLSRLEQAIEAFIARAARGDAPTLESCSLPRAPGRLSSLPDNLFVLCIQTIVRDYLTAAERETYETGMQAFLLKRPPHSALVVELEVDLGSLDVPAQSAMLVLRFASAEGKLQTMLMARTHPHPRQLFINPGAVDAFTDAFTPVGA